MKGLSQIAKIITKITAGFIMMFGFYILSHGNVNHGVGFAGGVIIALSLILIVLVFGRESSMRIISKPKVSFVMNICLLIFFILSAVSINTKKNGIYDRFHCSLIETNITVILNVLFCVVVACAIFMVFCNMTESKE